MSVKMDFIIRCRHGKQGSLMKPICFRLMPLIYKEVACIRQTIVRHY